ncbi:hypothetical protein [Ktedonospora formicarum]|uniref:Uncharacterized protein n=1 Tax=Ktedonospora formicarum TaxID=2778364 RepID=A0A8J3ICK3_9CHLR|nr:hypothetical protein [Ktedonospora formicarum]GHO49624.1 hypothetical protein KSX_77870 [Ktedonospora formicarum]
MIAVKTLHWIGGLVGLIALLLGLSYWIFQANVISFHMLAGLLVTLSMLILGIILAFTKGCRVLGIVGIVYALILPIFGMSQMTLLVGDLHWLIRVAHLLVGLGALAIIGFMGRNFLKVRGHKQPQVAVSGISTTQE